MARIGVCDDDPNISESIAELVDKAFRERGYICDVESYSDGLTLLGHNQLKPFDVLFLDIDMPQVGGFDIAKSLREKFSDCLIVFVTSHSELVYDSLDFQPFNFIRKNSGVPLKESIPKVVGKLAYYLRQEETVRIEDKSCGIITVKIRDILCIESSGHYLIYSILRDGAVKKIISRGSISEREEFFANYSFARAHKGFLINLSRISYIGTKRHEAELSGGVTVPIGKKYKSELEEKYSLFMRRKI